MTRFLAVVSFIFAISVQTVFADDNLGIKATSEEAQKAFQSHDKLWLWDSARDNKAQKDMQEAWSRVRDDLGKDGEENVKKREILGRLILIADANPRDEVKNLIDIFAAAYGTKLQIKNAEKIVDHISYVAEANQHFPYGFWLGFTVRFAADSLLEREFGKAAENEQKNKSGDWLSTVVSFCLGQSEGLHLKNPGAAATTEQAEAAFKSHYDKPNDSFSNKLLNIKLEAVLDGEGAVTRKQREIIGRLFIISDVVNDPGFTKLVEVFAFNCELIKPEKADIIVDRFWRTSGLIREDSFRRIIQFDALFEWKKIIDTLDGKAPEEAGNILTYHSGNTKLEESPLLPPPSRPVPVERERREG